MKLFVRLIFVNFFATLIICCSFNTIAAQTHQEQITERKNQLELLIPEAEGQGIDVLKERMTLRTAELFVRYANWDENNIQANKQFYELAGGWLRTQAQKLAEELPNLIRSNIVIMLDEAITNLSLLIEGKITRRPTPDIDWTQVTHEGDMLKYNDRPVFLTDYTWKPRIPELTEFHGNEDGFYVDPNRVRNAEGEVAPWLITDLGSKPDGSIGFIFLGNKTVPQWAEDKYGPGFRMRENTYVGYDIDNPGAREMWGFLFKGIVPLVAGKKYSELGYMLVNEPHFYTTKNVWATGPVSEYTKEKFRTWLSNKHESISDLNQLWGSSFSDFNFVNIEIPIDGNLQGTPRWYDWVIFNNYRVTEWYKWKKSEIQKHDPNTKVHLKIMTNLWSDNQRNHGIDLEALTEMSEISGNDAGAEYSYLWGGPRSSDWREHYSWNWRELCMSYDFMKSVRPENIIHNSELHFLSKVTFRDPYMDTAYARTTFWMAHKHGLNASQIWVWGRNEDGSIQSRVGSGYAGSLVQQPRIVNEVHSTMMDLNSFAEEITAFQQQDKPIRIFHSETSATNKPKHMDDVFELYESLFFEGIPLGFATRNILNNQDHSNWEVVLVHKTQYVTQEELDALQAYLNNGGTVIMDHVSLGKNEYGKTLASLNQGAGTLITVNSLAKIKEEALKVMDQKGHFPDVEVIETNTGGHKGCSWRAVRNEAGNIVLSVANMGKTNALLEIKLKDALKGTFCTDLLTGTHVTNKPILKPFEVYFVEITDDDDPLSARTLETKSPTDDIGILFPNPSDGEFAIKMIRFHDQIDMTIFTLTGIKIFSQRFHATNRISHNLASSPAGSYIIRLNTDSGSQSFMLIKR